MASPATEESTTAETTAAPAEETAPPAFSPAFPETLAAAASAAKENTTVVFSTATEETVPPAFSPAFPENLAAAASAAKETTTVVTSTATEETLAAAAAAGEAEAEGETVRLVSSDGQVFVVPAAIIKASDMIGNMIEDGCAGDDIPLPCITAPILGKVVEFCKRHAEAAAADAAAFYMVDGLQIKKSLKDFDAAFLKVDQDTLFDLILAANYLSIKTLLDLCLDEVANQLREKTVEEIREHFHIINDYTEEEEEQYRKEFAWAFD